MCEFDDDGEMTRGHYFAESHIIQPSKQYSHFLVRQESISFRRLTADSNHATSDAHGPN